MLTLGESRSISQTTERERRAQDNVSFNKWLGILAREDLPSKLHCSENGNLKSSASNQEDELEMALKYSLNTTPQASNSVYGRENCC